MSQVIWATRYAVTDDWATKIIIISECKTDRPLSYPAIFSPSDHLSHSLLFVPTYSHYIKL